MHGALTLVRAEPRPVAAFTNPSTGRYVLARRSRWANAGGAHGDTEMGWRDRDGSRRDPRGGDGGGWAGAGDGAQRRHLATGGRPAAGGVPRPLQERPVAARGGRGAGRHPLRRRGLHRRRRQERRPVRARAPTARWSRAAAGKQPPFVYGPPFPTIDTKDPQAGAKIVWNFFYQSYLLGNCRTTRSTSTGSARQGMERAHRDRRLPASTTTASRSSTARRPTRRTSSFQQISAVTQPADLQGTVALTHRYRDPTQRDSGLDLRAGAAPRARGVARPTAPTASSAPTCRRTTAPTSTASRRTSPGSWSARARCWCSSTAPSLMEQKATLDRLPDGGFEGSRSPAAALRLPDARIATRARLAPAARPSTCSSSARSGSSRARRRTATTSTARSSSASTRRRWRGTYNSQVRLAGPDPQLLHAGATGRTSTSTASGAATPAATFTMAQNWKLDRATVSYADPKTPVSTVAHHLPRRLLQRRSAARGRASRRSPASAALRDDARRGACGTSISGTCVPRRHSALD